LKRQNRFTTKGTKETGKVSADGVKADLTSNEVCKAMPELRFDALLRGLRALRGESFMSHQG
jgi:hypothetical protein